MMNVFARSDTSVLSRWWWEVDRWLLLALMLLISVGFLMTMAASPSVAERLGLDNLHFVKRQAVFLCMAIGGMLAVSVLTARGVRRLAVMLLPLFFLLVILTLFLGDEIKGATRWLQIGGFSLQPSEFLKPTFIVFTAWMFAAQTENEHFPGKKIAIGAFVIVVGALIMQPDFGQAFLLSCVFVGQFMLAGLPLFWIGLVIALGIGGATLAYFFVPHVQNRIDIFLNPSSGDSYQVDTALNAFRAGGLFGRGPGEGAVKRVLPDAHADYIFAVVGEEFGAIACLVILALFAVIVVRGLARLLDEENPFVVFAASGLMALFGLQAFINMAVNLAVMPSKGMTLPFMSYGGSSLLALGLTMGMILALTRRNEFLTPRHHGFRRVPRSSHYGR